MQMESFHRPAWAKSKSQRQERLAAPSGAQGHAPAAPRSRPNKGLASLPPELLADILRHIDQGDGPEAHYARLRELRAVAKSFCQTIDGFWPHTFDRAASRRGQQLLSLSHHVAPHRFSLKPPRKSLPVVAEQTFARCRTLSLPCRRIDLHDQSAVGTDPAALKRLGQILAASTLADSLSLSFQQLTELPPALARMTRLQALQLDHNRLTTLPYWFADTAQITTLNLDCNGLRTVPSTLFHMSQLKSLSLANNGLERIPSEIERLGQLCELNVADNRLHALPAALASMHGLRKLNASRNNLAQFPSVLAATRLTALHLGSNGLKQLPDEVGAMRALNALHLERNELSEVNPALGRLAELRVLDLRHNTLRALPLSLTAWAGQASVLIDDYPLAWSEATA